MILLCIYIYYKLHSAIWPLRTEYLHNYYLMKFRIMLEPTISHDNNSYQL